MEMLLCSPMCTEIQLFFSLILGVWQQCSEPEPLMACFVWTPNRTADRMNIS